MSEINIRRFGFIIMGMIIIFWVAGIMAAYYVVHKPWVFGNSIVPLLSIFDFVVAMSIVLVAGGLGRWVLVVFGLDGIGSLERIALSIAVGMGLIGLLLLFIGMAGLLYSWILGSLLILMVIILRRKILAWADDFKSLYEKNHSMKILSKFAALLILVVVISGLYQSLAPPLKWDSLVYHLAIPKEYVLSHKITFLEDNLFVGMNLLAEVIFVWGMALGSGSASACIGWAIGVITLIGIEGYSRSIIGREASWIAPAVLISGASISQALSWAYVDLWIMLFGFGVVYCLHQYLTNKNTEWLVLSGILTGFAISTKYSAGILVFVGCSAIILVEITEYRGLLFIKSIRRNIKSIRWGRFVRSLSIFCCVAFIVTSPWLIKNYILTGNPVYPFVFPGKEVDFLRQQFHAGLETDRSIWDDIFLPILVTVMGVEQGPGYNTSIGPLIVALIPGVFVGWGYISNNERYSYKYLIILAFTTWIIWGIGARIADPLTRTRHYYGVFPALALLSAGGFKAVQEMRLPGIRVGVTINVFVGMVFIFSLFGEFLHFATSNPLPVLLGKMSKEDYLSDQLGWYSPAMQTVNRLPAGSKVLFLWEARSYYCETNCSPDVILDRWWYSRRTIGDYDQIADSIIEKGFTHILIYDVGVEFEKNNRQIFAPSDWIALEDFIENRLILLNDFDGVYSLYSFRS